MDLAGIRSYINTYFLPDGTQTISGTKLRNSLLWLCDNIELQGCWAPVFAEVADGVRIVLKVVDWTGGVGVKPTINVYVGASGYTALIASAVDIRGPQGNPGVSSDGGLIHVASPGDGFPATRWLPIVTLPISSGGTFDMVRMNVVLGPTAAERQMIEAHFSNRGSFKYRWLTNGPANSNATVEAYQNTDTSVTIYVQLVNTFWMCNVKTPFYSNCTPNGALSPLAGSPPGTKIFDSNDTTTYPSMESIDAGVAEFVGLKTKTILSAGTTPTIATGSGLGTTGTTATVLAGSNNMAGKLTLTTTAGVASSATLATITFGTAYAAAPKAVIITPRNAKAAEQIARVYVSSITTTTFVLSSDSTALSQPDTFDFQYVVIA